MFEEKLSVSMPVLRWSALARVIIGGLLLWVSLVAVAAKTEAPASEDAAKGASPDAAKPADAAPENAAPATPPPVDTAPPAPIRNPPLRLEVRRNQPLARQIEGMQGADGNTVWLGDEADPFLGLYIQSYAGEPLGAVLLLHDNEQHPDWPGMLHELRVTFPQHGWSTLSIALPDYQPIPPVLPPLPKPVVVAPAPAATQEAGEKEADADSQDKTEKEDKSKDKDKEKKDKDKDKDKDASKDPKKEDGKDTDKKDGADDKPAETAPADASASAPPAPPPQPEFLQSDSEIPVDKFPAEIDRRIKEATRYLIGEGHQHVLIVAFGNTAGLSAHLSRNMLINELDGLIMMDPKPYPDRRYDLPSDVADLRIPLLDVVPEYESGSNPLLRKQATGRARTPQYEMRLVRGAAVNFSGYERYVFKAVRGWADAQFKNAPQKKGRKSAPKPQRSAPPKTTDKAKPPANAPATPGAPSVPPPKGAQPAPNLKEAIPPPIPG